MPLLTGFRVWVLEGGGQSSEPFRVGNGPIKGGQWAVPRPPEKSARDGQGVRGTMTFAEFVLNKILPNIISYFRSVI